MAADAGSAIVFLMCLSGFICGMFLVQHMYPVRITFRQCSEGEDCEQSTVVNSLQGPCILPTFIDKSFEYEFSYTFRTVLSQVSAHCGCSLHLRYRKQKGGREDVYASLEPNQPFLIIGNKGLSDQEATLLTGPARGTAGVFHLSDESSASNISWYPAAAFVYRNYLRDDAPPDVSYLLRQPASNSRQQPLESRGTASGPFWYPLGPASHFVPAASLVLPLSARPLWWTWIGSTQGNKSSSKPKPERRALIPLLSAPPLAPLGFLHHHAGFHNLAEMLLRGDYALHMQQAKFAPCPAGASPEQFRIWEALESGAIPVVLKEHLSGALRFLEDLDLPFGVLPSWSSFPDFILQQQQRPPADLDLWQAELQAKYARLKERLQRHVAKSVCTLAKRPQAFRE